jgi:hypothetical protein
MLSMTHKVFISYRRDESSAYAGRVHDRLEREFGGDLLFMDVDNVPLGENFVRVLTEEVARCEVLLAVMGPKWANAHDTTGKRRLDNKSDFVRVEIGAALQRGIPVIPILLDGAKIPSLDQLPEDLKELALRNALDVRHGSFHADMDRLIKSLNDRWSRGSSPTLENVAHKAASPASTAKFPPASRASLAIILAITLSGGVLAGGLILFMAKSQTPGVTPMQPSLGNTPMQTSSDTAKAAPDVFRLSGAWNVTWPNATTNAIALVSSNSGLSGTYTGDNKETCPLTGDFREVDRTVNINVKCVQWSVLMQGKIAPDTGSITGNYVAYGNTKGTFMMKRQ